MSLDPRIALGVQPMQIQSPMQGAQQALTLRDLMESANNRALQRDELLRQRQAAEQQQAARGAFLQAFQQNGGKLTPELVPLGLRAGMDPAKLQALAGAQDWGKPKVASWQEVRMPDGSPGVAPMDEHGQRMGPAMPKAVALKTMDTGGQIRAWNPYSGQVAGAVDKTVSPDSQLSAETARRGQDIAHGDRVISNAIADKSATAQVGNKQFTQEESLRKDYLNGSKNFITVRDAYTKIKASAQNPSAAGDLALIFNFMKLLDPTSVVREGEFATAQNSGGVDDKIRAMYNQVLNGQRLAPAVRADILSRSRMLFTAAQKDHGALKFQVEGMAKNYGLDPKRVTAEFKSSDLSQSDNQSGSTGQWQNGPSGERPPLSSFDK